MESNIILSQESSLTLSNEIRKGLVSYEDYISLYTQIQEASNTFSWLKADLFFEFSKKFGYEKSLEQLASDINEKKSTVTNYIRVAKAFPPDKRSPIASFTQFFICSFVDRFDRKSKTFLSDTRFDWIERAEDYHWTSRKLIKEIQESKIKEIDDVFEQLLTDGENKGKAIKILVDKLLARLRQGDEEAHREIVDIYIKIFGAL